MNSILGLGKLERQQLAEIMQRTKGTITVSQAAEILAMDPINTAKKLSLWMKKGWLLRVKRGLYVPVPLESSTADIAIEDSWIIANQIYSPCYIGGWSAAEYWTLTEQIFRSVLVMSTRKINERQPVFQDAEFQVRTISSKALFGLKPVWRGQVKVDVSDPSRTMVDMMLAPLLGGGIQPVVDIYRNYLASSYKDLDLLASYAKQLGKGVVFKRLGFLTERFAAEEEKLLAICRQELTKGYSNLDPNLSADRLIKRWNLWIPQSWITGDKE